MLEYQNIRHTLCSTSRWSKMYKATLLKTVNSEIKGISASPALLIIRVTREWREVSQACAVGGARTNE